jgi:hypothetical protein
MLHNRAGRVAQVVEHLPSKHETLSSNPLPSKEKKRKDVPQLKLRIVQNVNIIKD